jgi:hypothetical protein
VAKKDKKKKIGAEKEHQLAVELKVTALNLRT